MRAMTKNLALLFLSLTGAFRLGRRLSRHSLVVLTYHRVITGDSKMNAIPAQNSVFTWEFERQVEHLVRHYYVATGEEVRLFLVGDCNLPDNSVFITFDDGYENNFTHAFPILQRYGVTAAFFLTTDLIGQPDATLWFDRLDSIFSLASPGSTLVCMQRLGMPAGIQNQSGIRKWIKGLSRKERDRVIEKLSQQLLCNSGQGPRRDVTGLLTWDQVRQMAYAGMTIGSHTESHQILASASADEVERELLGSRLKIEEETDRPCWCFAYPNGENEDFRTSDKAALRRAGYLYAFTQMPGFSTPNSDHYALPRISIPDSGDIRTFASRVTGVHQWLQNRISGIREPEQVGFPDHVQ